MPNRITIGFPRMNKESAELRVFMPAFIQYLTHFADVYLEEGYGSRSGFLFDNYRRGNARVHQTSREDAFQKDYVIVLRSPNEDEFSMLRPGACLISMLHYPTRPRRVEILNQLGVNAISMDSVMDDKDIRLVENMRAVSWNGLEAAFDVLERDCPDLMRKDQPYRVLVLGAGMVGKHAVEAATKLGNVERYNRHLKLRGPGSIALTVGRSISQNPDQMRALMRDTDIIVDATSRHNTSQPVLPNEWIDWLPQHAVIADLAVDPYLLDCNPPVVRGVEGIPQGTLNQYIFMPDDPKWDKTVPESIPSENRRAVVSCYSWPGIHPVACMEHYGSQLEPLMEALLTKGYDGISEEGSYFERALARAKLPPVG